MNQGVLPVVLFPLEKTPFAHMRDVRCSFYASYSLVFFSIGPYTKSFCLKKIALCYIFRYLSGKMIMHAYLVQTDLRCAGNNLPFRVKRGGNLSDLIALCSLAALTIDL